MKQTIKFSNFSGHIFSKSRYFSSFGTCAESQEIFFQTGLNHFQGECDSAEALLSYALPMWRYDTKGVLLEHNIQIELDGIPMTLAELSQKACYLDPLYPLFSSRKTVEKLLKKYAPENHEEIKVLFELDEERCRRRLSQTGNEVVRAMAAIGYASGKEIFCFPWYSDRKYRYLKYHILFACKILEEHGKIILLPTSEKIDSKELRELPNF